MPIIKSTKYYTIVLRDTAEAYSNLTQHSVSKDGTSLYPYDVNLQQDPIQPALEMIP